MKIYSIILKSICILFIIFGLLGAYGKIMHIHNASTFMTIGLVTMISTIVMTLLDILIMNKSLKSSDRFMYAIGTIFITIIAAPLYIFNVRKWNYSLINNH